MPSNTKIGGGIFLVPDPHGRTKPKPTPFPPKDYGAVRVSGDGPKTATYGDGREVSGCAKENSAYVLASMYNKTASSYSYEISREATSSNTSSSRTQ
jgi:hypothetical protein